MLCHVLHHAWEVPAAHLSPCDEALQKSHAAHEVVQRQEAQLHRCRAEVRPGREGVLHAEHRDEASEPGRCDLVHG